MVISSRHDVEDCLLCLSFVTTGIITIVVISKMMCKALTLFCVTLNGNTKDCDDSDVVQLHGLCNGSTNYSEMNQPNCFNHLSNDVNNQEASHFSNKEEKGSSCYNMHTTHKVTRKNTEEINIADLLKLLLYCCLFENICIVLHASINDEVFKQELPHSCNTLDGRNDCFALNAVLVLHKNYTTPSLYYLGFTILSAVPILFCLLTQCFQSYVKIFFISSIILLSVLLSKWFSYLFFPNFIFQACGQNYIFQRLLSSWLAFLSMSIGIKLANEKTNAGPNKPTTHLCYCHTDNAEGMTEKRNNQIIQEGNNFLHVSKRNHRRSQPEMTVGSDAFYPCFVLMKDLTTNPNKHHSHIGTPTKHSRSRRRASLDIIKKNNVIEESAKWSALKHRRTSLPAALPAGCKKKTVMSSVLLDAATLGEVHSIVDELSNKPTNLSGFVKKLQDLLRPYKLDHVKPRQVVWLPNNTDGSDDDETLCMTPRHTTSKQRFLQRRFDSHSGLFSTTTTATGLPKEEPGPTKSKRLPKIPKDKTPLSTPIDSRCSSPTGDGPQRHHMGRRKTYPSIPTAQTHRLSFSYPSHQTSKKFSTISSDYESDEPSSLAIPLTNQRSLSTSESDSRRSSHLNHYFPDDLSQSTLSLYQEFPPVHTVTSSATNVDGAALSDDEAIHCNQCLGEQTNEGHFNFQNYQETLLESVYNWNFPIFELAEKTDCVLSQMAFKLFQNTGLFDTFKIPKAEFVRYMKVLESGYREIPYHNRIHAADVLHGCWFLTTQEIPGFDHQSTLFSSDSSDSDSGTSTIQPTRQVDNIGYGSLAQAIPALELLALYLAAAMHDFDHPGRTNAFLVETRHPLAILYNDRSVLENHHAAASWELLYSNKNFDFLRNLERAEWKRLRFLIVEAILATDLKKHFDILSQFSAKAQNPLSQSTSTDDEVTDSVRKNGIDWKADADRLLVCQMVIKLADIGGPAKLKPLHITWTKAICEEFFIQGDEERALNVPVSPFMDRGDPQVAELQRTFINNLIKPIVVSMHDTGILAGEIPDEYDIIPEQCHSDDRNLLVEQLNSNLNFWKTKTPYTGHDEMLEAFKYALTFRLGDNCSSEDFFTSKAKVSKGSRNPFEHDKTKSKDAELTQITKRDNDNMIFDDFTVDENARNTSDLREMAMDSTWPTSRQRPPTVTIMNNNVPPRHSVVRGRSSLPTHLSLFNNASQPT